MTKRCKLERRNFLKLGAALSVSSVVGCTGAASAKPKEAVVTKRAPTPPEIEGPFYPVTAQHDKDFDLTRIEGKYGVAKGEPVYIVGHVTDEQGNDIEGALLDIWQANTHGRYRHPSDPSSAPLDENFQGWAMIRSEAGGGFRFKTIIPGAYAVTEEWMRPPHIHFKVSKRGYEELATQMYFPGEALNRVDRLLLSKPKTERSLMIAKFMANKDASIPTYEYHIVLKRII